MKFQAAVLLALGASAATETQFESYLKTYGKAYGPTTYGYREAIYLKHLAKIEAHNADPSHSWKMGVNEFTDLTPEEFRTQTKGFHQQKHMMTSKMAINHVPPPVNEHYVNNVLPKEVDWRTKGVVTPVKNQGNCGSCWTFSVAEVLESHIAIETGKLLTFSEQELVDCAPDTQHCGGSGGCDGATQPLGFEYVEQAGITLETSYPYQAQTNQCKAFKPVAGITGHVELPSNNYTALLEAVALKGPISISLDAGHWQFYESGVYHGECGPDVNHAVVLVGYGTDAESGLDYWLIRNSWGPTFGEGGYIRIRRDSEPTCATDNTPMDGMGCPGGPDSVTVCGLCGILYASSYPVGGHLL